MAKAVHCSYELTVVIRAMGGGLLVLALWFGWRLFS